MPGRHLDQKHGKNVEIVLKIVKIFIEIIKHDEKGQQTWKQSKKSLKLIKNFIKIRSKIVKNSVKNMKSVKNIAKIVGIYIKITKTTKFNDFHAILDNFH